MGPSAEWSGVRVCDGAVATPSRMAQGYDLWLVGNRRRASPLRWQDYSLPRPARKRHVSKVGFGLLNGSRR